MTTLEIHDCFEPYYAGRKPFEIRISISVEDVQENAAKADPPRKPRALTKHLPRFPPKVVSVR